MKDQKTITQEQRKTSKNTSPPPPEEICMTVDCYDCPYFLRLEFCGYDYARPLVCEV